MITLTLETEPESEPDAVAAAVAAIREINDTFGQEATPAKSGARHFK